MSLASEARENYEAAYSTDYNDGVPIQSLIVGKSQLSKTDTVYIVLTGNPGVVEFYEVFMQKLYSLTGKPSIAIGLSGHCDAVWKRSHYDAILLKEQISHRLAMIRRLLVQTNCGTECESIKNGDQKLRIVFLTHSIGSYMVLFIRDELSKLETLETGRNRLQSEVTRTYMLFPTFERMRDSPKGKRLTFVKQYCLSVAYVLLVFQLAIPRLIHLFLPSLFRVLLRLFFGQDVTSAPSNLRGIATVCAHPVGKQMLYLGCAEMEEVYELPTHLVEPHLERTEFLYGATDHWAPAEFCGSLRKRFPNASIYLDESGWRHAFCLHPTDAIAVANWVAQRESKHLDDVGKNLLRRN